MSSRTAIAPKGYRTVTPQLVVCSADQALAYYEEVFGATLLSSIPTEDGTGVLQAELKIGNSVIRLMDEMPAFGILSPYAFGGSAVAIHLYVADADTIWEKALAAGAVVLSTLEDMPWGERYGRFIDPYGHVWSVSRRLPKSARKPVPAEKVSEVAPEETGETPAGPFSVHEPRADLAEPTVEQTMAAPYAATAVNDAA